MGLVTGPPLALVLIMVLALVMPRFSEASAATDNRNRVDALRYVVEVINRLEDEAALSLWAISGGGEEIRRDLAEARLSTDAAILEMVSYLEGDAELDVSEVAPALSAVSYIDEYRAGLDGGEQCRLIEQLRH